LLRYEVNSALYRKAFRALVSFDDSLQAIGQFTRLDINFLDPPGLPRRAAELANLFKARIPIMPITWLLLSIRIASYGAPMNVSSMQCARSSPVSAGWGR
jgi:hypothetical protein